MRLDAKEAVNGRRFFLFLALYLLLHLVIRAVVTGNAELDEAEQLVWGQQLRLGYGAELPLYTWLQAILFSLFGTNIIAVSLLRTLLLFTIYLFTYLNACEITGSERCGVAAAASLMLIPLISWEAQRILITMVLATALTAVSLFFFLRMLRTGLLRHYLLFGLAAGLGMLTKYNFGIFLAALLLSALSLRTFRSRLANMKFLATVAGLTLVTAAPFSWILSHPAAAMAKAIKLHPDQRTGLIGGYLAGFGQLFKAVAGFHLFLVPTLLSIFARAPVEQDDQRQNNELKVLIGRTILIGISICCLMVLFFHVTHFKSRWLLPVLFPAPLYLVAHFQSRVGVKQLRILTACAGVVASVILVAMPARIVLASHAGTQGRMNFPYGQLAVELRNAGFVNGLIIAENNLLGGNLRLRFPQCGVVVPTAGNSDIPRDKPLLLVWDAAGHEGVVPARISSLADSLDITLEGNVRYVEAPSLYLPGKKARLGFIILEPQQETP